MEAKFSGWKIAAALWLIIFVNLAFTSYGSGVIGAVMLTDLDISRSVLGLGFTVYLLAQGLGAPAVAWGINRFGTRLTLTAGSLFLALSAFALAHFSTEGWHYVLFFGLGIGIGVGFSTLLPVQTCVAMWFTKRRGLAMAVVLAATGVGGFVAAPLLNHVIALNNGDWRYAWYLVALGSLACAAIAYGFVRNTPADLGQLPDGAAANQTDVSSKPSMAGRKLVYRSSIDWLVKEALKTRSKWLIALASVGYAMPISTFIAHGAPHLTDIGHSGTSAALALGTVAIFGTLGKLIAGYLCDRFEPRYVWFGCLLMEALGIALATQAHDQTTIYVFAALLGAGYGGSLVCWPTMVANYFGAKSMASIMGLQFPINAVGSALAPLAVGILFDRLGSYSLSFFGVGALTLTAATLLLIATPPVWKQSEQTQPA